MNIKYKLKVVYALILFSVQLVGCGVTGSKDHDRYGVVKEGPDGPELSNYNKTPGLVDLQGVLRGRGLYVNNQGMISLLDAKTCKTETIAHRGDYRYPENSRSAISSALSWGFDSVEIDGYASFYNDGWRHVVISHDKNTGRANGRSDGKRVDITRIGKRDFVYLAHRSKVTGEITNQRIPLLTEAVAVFDRDKNNVQQLNLELKGDYSLEHLADIDDFLRYHIPGQYYYSSLNLDNLEKIRKFNTATRLVFIQKPHNQSIEVKKSAYRKGVQHDYTYQRYQSKAEMLASIGTNRYRSSNRKTWYNPKGLTALQKVLGPNTDIAVDIRTYAETPHLLSNAHSRGMKVLTYTINENKYHIKELMVQSQKKRMPDGVIADMSPVQVCQIEKGGLEQTGSYQPTTERGKLLHALPADADINLPEQEEHLVNGFYETYWGEMRSLDAGPAVQASAYQVKKAAVVKKDAGVKGGDSKTIKVSFPVE